MSEKNPNYKSNPGAKEEIDESKRGTVFGLGAVVGAAALGAGSSVVEAKPLTGETEQEILRDAEVNPTVHEGLFDEVLEEINLGNSSIKLRNFRTLETEPDYLIRVYNVQLIYPHPHLPDESITTYFELDIRSDSSGAFSKTNLKDKVIFELLARDIEFTDTNPDPNP